MTALAALVLRFLMTGLLIGCEATGTKQTSSTSALVPDIVGRRPAQELFGHGLSTHASKLSKLSPGQLVRELG